VRKRIESLPNLLKPAPPGPPRREFLQKNCVERGLISLKCAVTLRRTLFGRAVATRGGKGSRGGLRPGQRPLRIHARFKRENKALNHGIRSWHSVIH
jgi:hypothetical protein